MMTLSDTSPGQFRPCQATTSPGSFKTRSIISVYAGLSEIVALAARHGLPAIDEVIP
jgi:hypothetical protein